MANEESKRWLKAGIELSKDVNAQILCPHCGQTNLSVEDIFYKNMISEVITHPYFWRDFLGSRIALGVDPST